MIDLLSRKLAIQASTNVTSVLSSNGAGVVGTTQGQSVQQALDQLTGGNVVTPPARTSSTGLYVPGGQQVSGGGSTLTSTSPTLAALTGSGAVLRDIALVGGTVSNTTSVIGVNLTGVATSMMSNVSVDLSSSAGIDKPAFNLTNNIVDHFSFGLRGITGGYGYLTNEALGSTTTMDGHVLLGFNIKAMADAIEYNNPGAPLKHTVTWGGIMDAGRGGTGSTSGFALGLAHNQGWVAGGFVSRYSRSEGVHIEDGSAFGVLSSFVLRGCQSSGIWASIGGYGGNTAQATPTVITGFSIEGPGASAGANSGLHLVYDTSGCCMNWPVVGGYVKAFQTALVLDGKGVKPATWVAADACTNVLQLNASANHRGTLFSNGAANLLSTTGIGGNFGDRFVQNDVAATKLINPTGARSGIRDAIRGFDMPALGSLSALPAAGYAYVPLFQAPARMRGQLTLIIGGGVIWHATVNCDDGLTMSALSSPVMEAINTVSLSTIAVAGGTAVSSGTSSSVITVSAPTAALGAGQTFAAGLIAGTRIVRQLTGTTGGAGTYLIDIPQTVAAATAFTTSSPFRFNAGNIEVSLYNAGTAIAAGSFPIRVEFDGLFYA